MTHFSFIFGVWEAHVQLCVKTFKSNEPGETLEISRGKSYHFKLCFYEFNYQIFKKKLLGKSIIYRLPDGLYDLLFTDVLSQKSNAFLA